MCREGQTLAKPDLCKFDFKGHTSTHVDTCRDTHYIHTSTHTLGCMYESVPTCIHVNRLRMGVNLLSYMGPSLGSVVNTSLKPDPSRQLLGFQNGFRINEGSRRTH